MSYDLLRFSLLFRRFVTVKADSTVCAPSFHEEPSGTIKSETLSRSPTQSNTTHPTPNKAKASPSIDGTFRTQQNDPCRSVRVYFEYSSLTLKGTPTTTTQQCLNPSPFSAGLCYASCASITQGTPTTSCMDPHTHRSTPPFSAGFYFGLFSSTRSHPTPRTPRRRPPHHRSPPLRRLARRLFPTPHARPAPPPSLAHRSPRARARLAP